MKRIKRPSRRIVSFLVVTIAISFGVAAKYQPFASFQGDEAAVRDVTQKRIKFRKE